MLKMILMDNLSKTLMGGLTAVNQTSEEPFPLIPSTALGAIAMSALTGDELWIRELNPKQEKLLRNAAELVYRTAAGNMLYEGQTEFGQVWTVLIKG